MYKLLINNNVKVVIKSLNIELRGGFFYTQEELERVYNAGYTSVVGKVKPKAKKEAVDE
jgi:hypothetical protein